MSKNVVRFDWAIKRLLRNKANFVVLEGFLTTLLGRKVIINKILESESNQENENDKFNRVDLLAEDESGEMMIFEVQNDRELDFFHRMLYGTSKVVSEYISLHEAYQNVRKVYSINIVYFSLGVGDDYVYHGKTEFYSLHKPTERLSLTPKQRELFHVENVYNIFPEYYLLRVENFDRMAASPLDEWISYLKSGVIEERFSAPGLTEARNLLLFDNMSPKDREAYTIHMNNLRYQHSILSSNYDLGKLDGRAEGREEGLAEGHAAGLEEGREAGKLEVYRTVVQFQKSNGKSLKQVAEDTGFPIDIVSQCWE